MHLTDEELEVVERWITELQDLFAEATALKIQYIQISVRSEIVARENTLRHGSEMKERQRQGGGFACNLIVSKNQLAPTKKCPSKK